MFSALQVALKGVTNGVDHIIGDPKYKNDLPENEYEGNPHQIWIDSIMGGALIIYSASPLYFAAWLWKHKA